VAVGDWRLATGCWQIATGDKFRMKNDYRFILRDLLRKQLGNRKQYEQSLKLLEIKEDNR
jgi:hypothetical protein